MIDDEREVWASFIEPKRTETIRVRVVLPRQEPIGNEFAEAIFDNIEELYVK